MFTVVTEGDISDGYRIIIADYHDSIRHERTPARPKHCCWYDCTLLYSTLGMYCILLYCAPATNLCMSRNLPYQRHTSRIKLQTSPHHHQTRNNESTSKTKPQNIKPPPPNKKQHQHQNRTHSAVATLVTSLTQPTNVYCRSTSSGEANHRKK